MWFPRNQSIISKFSVSMKLLAVFPYYPAWYLVISPAFFFLILVISIFYLFIIANLPIGFPSSLIFSIQRTNLCPHHHTSRIVFLFSVSLTSVLSLLFPSTCLLWVCLFCFAFSFCEVATDFWFEIFLLCH